MMGLYDEFYGPADELDLELAAKRQINREMLYDNRPEPLEGDVVQFTDGTRYRVSHAIRHYDYEDGGEGHLHGVQTTKGGSFHWNTSGGMSYSGSLFKPIPADTFTFHGETAPVRAWIFHHDKVSAHRSVDVTARVRVWHTTAPVPAI
jgi:signal peptidase I